MGGGKQEAQMVDDRLWTMLLWMYYLVVLVEVLSSIIEQRLWPWYVLVLGSLEYYCTTDLEDVVVVVLKYYCTNALELVRLGT